MSDLLYLYEYKLLSWNNDDSCSFLTRFQTMNDDSQKYKETLQALQILGFDLEEKMNILKIIASILHLGNIKVYEHKETCKIKNMSTVHIAADVIQNTNICLKYMNKKNILVPSLTVSYNTSCLTPVTINNYFSKSIFLIHGFYQNN